MSISAVGSANAASLQMQIQIQLLHRTQDLQGQQALQLLQALPQPQQLTPQTASHIDTYA